MRVATCSILSGAKDLRSVSFTFVSHPERSEGSHATDSRDREWPEIPRKLGMTNERAVA